MFLSRPLFFLALFALLGELILSPEIPFSYRFLLFFFLLFLSLFLLEQKKNRLLFCSFLCLVLFMLNFYSVYPSLTGCTERQSTVYRRAGKEMEDHSWLLYRRHCFRKKEFFFTEERKISKKK